MAQESLEETCSGGGREGTSPGQVLDTSPFPARGMMSSREKLIGSSPQRLELLLTLEGWVWNYDSDVKYRGWV